MSLNKKIHYGDRFPTSILENITEQKPPNPSEGRFTFDSTAITFDSMIRTFDEN